MNQIVKDLLKDKNAEIIDLSEQKITDISELEGLKDLPNLKDLSLHRNQIEEIKGLEALTSLEVLRLDENHIKSIKGVEAITNLKFLSLGGNG